MDGVYEVATKHGNFTLRPEPRTYGVRNADGLLIGQVIQTLTGWKVPTLVTQTTVWGEFASCEDAVAALAHYAHEVTNLREDANRRLKAKAREIREQASAIDEIASKR